MTPENDALLSVLPCESNDCQRPGYIKSEQWGARLCPTHALIGPRRVVPPAEGAPERDRAAEIAAAEDRAEQAAYDAARERS